MSRSRRDRVVFGPGVLHPLVCGNNRFGEQRDSVGVVLDARVEHWHVLLRIKGQRVVAVMQQEFDDLVAATDRGAVQRCAPLCVRWDDAT